MASTSSFYQTTNGYAAQLISDPITADQAEKAIQQLKERQAVRLSSYQFSRESDRIGSTMTNTEALVAINNKIVMPKRPVVEAEVKRTADEALANYRHEPKSEHPRYQTSANDFGRKPPNVATVVVERNSKKQDFSRSFGNVKPRNSSMNTAITRSTIHDSLEFF